MQQGGKRSAQTTPKVTLVCVTYNAEDALPGLLQSIAKNKTADTEVIIIDGNSTDSTLDIVKQNETLIDFWLSEPDGGIYEAMNKAISYVGGQWIVFFRCGRLNY